MTDQSNNPAPDRPLRRLYPGRLVGGVASGLAAYLDLDVTVVRLAFVLLALGGIGIPLYLAGWLLIPDEHSNVSVAADLLDRHQTA